MQLVHFFSASAIPATIIIIILWGLKDKVKIFDTFLEGSKDGIKIVVELFPTLLGIFLAVGLLRNSGFLDFVISIVSSITNLLKIPSQILPLIMLRPISGSASIGVAVDIMKNYGVDSLIGNITSTIMGSTETTFYVIAIYTSCVKIKKIRFALLVALLSDIVGIIVAVAVYRIMS